MGCDIHMFVEKKENGKWEKLTKKFKNPYHNPDAENKIDSDGYEWNPEFIDEPYSSRNYDLFAILADVRNGRGFGGVYTGEGFNPISDPKGLPDDVSAEVKKHSDEYGIDGHSHSWFTLKELKDFDWSQETITHDRKESYNEASGNFLESISEKLKPFSDSDEHIRIVFFFDN